MNKIPVIIDTDPGVDDIVALLFALASPEIEILAIIVSFGNTDLNSSLLNVLKAYQAVEDHLKKYPGHAARFPNFFASMKTIVVRGQEKPLAGQLMDARYFHGRDGLGDISERHPDLGPANHTQGHPRIQMAQESGTDVCLSLIRSYPALSITYVTLGPLTSFAVLIRTDRALVTSRIGRVVCMGGALDVPGNTSPVAEFNFFADPYAVKEILCPAGEPPFPLKRFLLVPLDITTTHELPFPVYKERVDHAFAGVSTPSVSLLKPPLIHFTSSFLERTRDVMLRFGKDVMELHDIVAVWCAISHPPSPSENLAPGWEIERRIFDIERTGELTRGMLVVDRREDESAYSLGANRAEVQDQLEKDGKTVPVRVELESLGRALPGVLCVARTPGPDVLLELLLKRVWGV